MSGLAVTPPSRRPLLGISLMLLAYLCFSLLDSSVKWLSIGGMAALQLAFVRYAGHFVITLLLISRGGIGLDRFGTDRVGLVVLRGLLLMLSTAFNFWALRFIPLTLTSTIMFMAPIIICALSGPMLGERVGKWRWMAIVAGFVGVTIAIRPFDAAFHWAVLLSLSNTLCFALYAILTRKLAGQVATDTQQLYSGLVGTVVLLPFGLLAWQWPQSPLEWVLLSLLGFFGWLGHEFLTRAHGFAEASTLTPFTYVFIIYMTVSSYLVFNQPPDRWTLAGAFIVVSAGLLIWFRERALAQRGAQAVSASEPGG